MRGGRAAQKGVRAASRVRNLFFSPQSSTHTSRPYLDPRQQGETRMLMTKIPHFREVMVCSFECPHCGNR